jgi:metal-sulfur cluster biosynthetic enzyme
MGHGTSDDRLAGQVQEALREVLDPEVGIDIVELGLVYAVTVREGDVRVTLTMTSSACPLHEHVTASAEAAIRRSVPGVRSVRVDLVWDPPWRPDMLSAAAKRQLGWGG